MARISSFASSSQESRPGRCSRTTGPPAALASVRQSQVKRLRSVAELGPLAPAEESRDVAVGDGEGRGPDVQEGEDGKRDHEPSLDQIGSTGSPGLQGFGDARVLPP